MSKLKFVVRTNFHNMITELGKRENINMLFDKKRMDKVNYFDRHNETNYEGVNNSGFMSLTLMKILNKDYPMIRVYETENKNYNKHIFLYVDGKYIVDPTYRQHLNFPNMNREYYHFLFSKNDPVFVGTYSDMSRLLFNLKNIDVKGNEKIRWEYIVPYWFGEKKDITKKYLSKIKYLKSEKLD